MKPQKDKYHTQEQYIFPEESSPHEATWLQWPHHHTYGKEHPQKLEPIFMKIVQALRNSEKVRIIAYDQAHRDHLKQILGDLNNIEFFLFKTDDVWVRDNGPIFVRNKRTQELEIEQWGFNGWGKKASYSHCEKIPAKIAQKLSMKLIDLRYQMVNEGGSVETDGKGVMMCCASSILNNNRNKGLRKKDAEEIFSAYYGAHKIIWLQGVIGEDITDCHIDGFVKFVNGSTLLTFPFEDLVYWGINKTDIETIYSATNIDGERYRVIEIPLSKNEIKTKGSRKKAKNIGKGSYLNFYIANKAVLVPTYNDPNDEIALQIIRQIYPERQVHGIYAADLFAEGGMIHCVTQQQPQ